MFTAGRRQVSVFKGFTAKDLEKGAKILLDSQLLMTLRIGNKLHLSRKKLHILARHVPVSKYVFKSTDEQVAIEIELARSNDLPALGAEIWTAKRLILFGGFATVKGPDSEEAEKWIARLRNL